MPVRVWMIDTLHDISAQTAFKHIPSDLISGLLSQFAKGFRMVETTMFLAIHNKANDLFDLIVVQTDDQGQRHEVRKLLENLPQDEVLFNMRLNEMRIVYDPQWRGKREPPLEFQATSYEGMLKSLELHKRKEQFVNAIARPNNVPLKRSAFGLVVEGVGPADMVSGDPSQIEGLKAKDGAVQLPVVSESKTESVELTRQGKIPARKRAALVKKYGETNIADLEARIAQKLQKQLEKETN